MEANERLVKLGFFSSPRSHINDENKWVLLPEGDSKPNTMAEYEQDLARLTICVEANEDEVETIINYLKSIGK